MGNLVVDTNKLRSSGDDILKLTSELNEELKVFFSRISNMNVNTFEWVGEGSSEFIRRANIEKAQYIKIKDELYKYGKTLCDAASEYEKSVGKLG